MKLKTLILICLALTLTQRCWGQGIQLTVDRGSGAVELTNTGDAAEELKGYTIGSAGNFLSLDSWSSLADGGNTGWREANPTSTFLSELNRDDGLVLDAGGSVALGSAYVTGGHAPDLIFEYITTERIATSGAVLYTGPANDLAVYVDPTSGDAFIANLSPFLDPISVKGYSILSASSGLNSETWTSIADSGAAGWLEANPAEDHLSELNRDSELVFSNTNPISIGQILEPGSEVRDLVFEYFTSAGEVQIGSVEYIPLPGEGGGCDPTTAGDLDGNGTVEFADFLVLSGNFGQMVSDHTEGDIDCNGSVEFADFLVLSGNFGQQVGAVSVPEPTASNMLGLAVLLFGVSKRRQR